MRGKSRSPPTPLPASRWWRCWNAQGVTSALPFVIGDLPEIVEQETEGDPIPVPVSLPVTINGRVFPREDVDIWSFEAQAGQSITCAAVAKKLGSPLVAKLEVRDATGKSIAESTGTTLDEARLRFTAPTAGRYEVRITDAAAGGLQHYVYRLTVTAGPWIDHVYPLGGKRGSNLRLETIGQAIPENAVAFAVPADAAGTIQPRIEIVGQDVLLPGFDVSDLPEHLEAEPNESSDKAAQIAVPAVINGRIQRPGDTDVWWMHFAAGKPVQFDARVSRLGSPLALVLTIRDPAGKQLFQADATTSTGDLSASFTPAADGVHLVEISERFARRGGPEFAYRVQISFPQPDFQLFVPDAIAVDVGGQKNVEVADRAPRRYEIADRAAPRWPAGGRDLRRRAGAARQQQGHAHDQSHCRGAGRFVARASDRQSGHQRSAGRTHRQVCRPAKWLRPGRGDSRRG